MTKPFEYQKQCAIQIAKLDGRALLAMDMGTGKSLTSLLWAKWNPEIRPVVIVCPASLKWNWQRELTVHFNWRGEILEGRRGRTLTPRTTDFWIINYDVLKDWVRILQDAKPQLVILDEVQYIKEKSAKRSKAVRSLCQSVEHIIALSGTPITNRPAELWHILHIIRPDIYKSFHSFANTYCNPVWTRWGWQYPGARDLPKLHRKLKRQLLIRKRKQDVLKDLPEKIRTVIPLPLDDAKEYEAARNEFLVWLERVYPKKVKKAAKAEQIVKLGYLKRLAAERKLAAVMKWIDDFLEGEDGKLILFAIHKKIIDEIRKRYTKISVVVTGEVKSRDRQLAFDRFNKDPKIRLFIGNIQAAGTGWNGTIATTVAFAELGWTSAEHIQAEDRAHRIGQKDGVNCVYLVARGTIEEKLCGVLERKQRHLMEILDGTVTDDQMDIYEQLSRSLKAEKCESTKSLQTTRSTSNGQVNHHTSGKGG